MKKLILLLTFMLLLSISAGCQIENAATSQTPSSSGVDEGGSQPSEEPSPLLGPQELSLPLSSERVEFDIWCGYAPQTGLTDMNDNLSYQIAEKRTNVHINFTHAIAGSIEEGFMLSLASQNLPDSYQTITSLWSSGFDSYIENDTIIDLNPYMEYAPNYNYVRHLNNTYPTTVTDSGYAPGFFMIAKTLQWAVLGPIIRQDFLDEVGKNNPSTYDELRDVLVSFKDYGIKVPFALPTTGLADFLMVGYNTIYTSGHGGTQFLVDDNGKVSFAIINEGAFDYLSMLNQWYNEGLIEADFFSKDTSFFFHEGRMANDDVGLVRTVYSGGDLIKATAINSNFHAVGMNIPTINKGDKIGISFGAAATSYNKDCISVITTACDNVEMLMKWHDYFFTEEGSLLANYGVEGDTFEFNANGKPVYTSKIYANPDVPNKYDNIFTYCFSTYQGFWYDWERELTPDTSQDTLDTKDYWEKNVEAKYNLPQISLTAEESSIVSAILGDLYTYIDEMVLKFIVGDEPLSEWDSYVDQVNSMEINTVIEIYQRAYDRYLERMK